MVKKLLRVLFLTKRQQKKRQQKLFVDDNVNNSVDGNPEGNEEILFLRNLVSELQSEKKELHKLLDQQQRLALQDKKMIEDYKSEINDLRALNMPMNSKNDPSVNNDQEELAQLKLKIKILEERTNSEEKETGKIESKKWWRLWK